MQVIRVACFPQHSDCISAPHPGLAVTARLPYQSDLRQHCLIVQFAPASTEFFRV